MAKKWGNDEWAAFSFVVAVVVMFIVTGALIAGIVSFFFGPLIGIVVGIVSVVGWFVYRVKREWMIK